MQYSTGDKEVFDLIKKEEERQNRNIELIASENLVSDNVRKAQGSVLTNKYAEGYPGHRYYGGCEYIDQIEQIAIDRAKKLFNAEYANVQPHSGSQANAAAYQAVLKPGDSVLGMDLNAGGHLTHGSKVNFSGKMYNFHSYGVNAEGFIDYDDVQRIAEEVKPKLIVAGASAYSRIIDFNKFREIADSVGAYLMVDMAHIAGLVAVGLHPNPVGVADIVTTTTHKTLRGPRGGMILAKAELGKKINSAIFPGTQGGPLEHVIAGKAVAFGEDLQPQFKDYMEQVVKNAAAMAKVINDADNLSVLTGGTDNHLLNVVLTETDMNGMEVQNLLDTIHITTNKEAIPNDPLPPKYTSGLRLGTPAITSRGFNEEDCEEVARIIVDAIKYHNDPEELKKLDARTKALTDKHPIK
ncbi:glycine hydroxymethyltransferase [Companilactobacillus paralimentarius DSM 13238 = JCM 10415]|uniref:Serine hydroxymethyltransferase n=3 Tax=Companilactobacillus TaxID=2767879 RepID=A0ABR5NW21_9LACO|nr:MULTISPECIES: serine hydroxymethyltransferase [Companilactobacillus]OWF32875.1 Glycine hydroxymethyltransferase [Companilactobacillus kimchii]KRK53078.1 glycine hydroxymethyltransferase [Companilactobacillus kimchii DSM 13961 = JCM 10707]KRL31644.1 glycine hydroxymethyltransferase [Companilactobacillus paralimentarius DSM 13238 = JCM 10415]MDR4933663.1 serine hydroxymethyltransferase [Companilactobacillus paralimentarius]GEO48431.1 serine hydroxymethyltransferase [Companilactobacillus paral